MRRISFELTPNQLLDGSKTVTRRMGCWANLKTGDRLLAVSKCMGLKRGEQSTIYGPIEVVAVRREPLVDITPSDVKREGFPEMTIYGFMAFFCKSHKNCNEATVVTRIEFRKLF